MSVVIEALSWICLLGGGFFSVAGGIGALRLPDVYTRLHSTGMADTMGAALILVGLMIQAGPGLMSVKLVLILVFLWMTSPIATHAVAHAALRGGVEPVVGRNGGS